MIDSADVSSLSLARKMRVGVLGAANEEFETPWQSSHFTAVVQLVIFSKWKEAT